MQKLRVMMWGLAASGLIALFIVPPLMAPSFDVREGRFQAEILASVSGMGMAARPVVRAQVKDSQERLFWVRMPSTSSVAPGTPLQIDVWCETDAYESCTARYASAAPAL